MEITEQWIGKAAGGRIFKEARSLLRLGKVIQVTRKGDVFQGQISAGRRPMQLVVEVLGPTQVKNHCGCPLSRSTGAMCEHAAALLLAGIQKPDPLLEKETARSDANVKAPGNLAVPLEIRLSPQFPHEGLRTIHLRPVKGEMLDSSDTSITSWMLENTGQSNATMLSLPEDKIAGFYRVASGHTRITRGHESVSISVATLRPKLDLELEGTVMWLRLAEGQDGLFLLGSELAEWDNDSNQLMVAQPQESERLSEVIPPEELIGSHWLQMDTSEFVNTLNSLAEVYQLPGDLGGLDIQEAVPKIELKISGSTRALQASLLAVYGENVRIPIAATKHDFPDTPLPTEQPNKWLTRNPDIEHAAIARLMEGGFQLLDASGSFYLQGEDESLDFLTTSLPKLRQRWLVKTEKKLAGIESSLGRIVPQIDIQGSGSDWLACDVSWQCGSEMLNRDTVRKILQSGSRALTLPRGGKAVISHFDAEVMEGFMLDTDPRQEDGRFYFPASQSAYLQRMRSYYSKDKNDGDSQEKLPVPDLPTDLNDTLRDYQREGVQWLYRRAASEGAALLADDMGLGKTLQTLAFIQLWKNNSPEKIKAPALVVCPATLLGNWRDEATKFVPDLSVLIMHGARRKDYYEVMAAADIIITSYALLDIDCAHYQKIKLGAVILDEASAIRNPDTLAAKAARKMKAAVRIAITGTPVENSVRDLWSIFQFLMPSYLGGREDFRLRYELPCAADVPDRAAIQRLRWRTSPFMLRRTKSTVAKDLPAKLESVVWCDPSPLQREYYQGILRHGAEKVDAIRQSSGSSGARMQILTVLLRLRQSCCDLRLIDSDILKKPLAQVSVKLARLMELLDEAQRGGHRVLVFSQFTSMLALIRDELEREDIDYSYLDGSTRERSSVVERFQNPSGPPVFLISLKAGGYGLTLTAADTVVLFDPWWNPAVEAQAADRIHRIGQTKPATIYKFITRGTVEEKILRLQEKKRRVISAAMGDLDDEAGPMMSGLSEGELLELLE